MSIKSNAEKVEKYLYRCSMDPVLKSSSLLRDFLTPQRDGDTSTKSHDKVAVAYPSPSASYDLSAPNDDTITTNDQRNNVQLEKVWVPSPHPSVISLASTSSQPQQPLSSIHSLTSHGNESELSLVNYSYPSSIQHSALNDDDEDDLVHVMTGELNSIYEFPLDNLEMIKVLGKGCMGKVSSIQSRYMINIPLITLLFFFRFSW